MTMNNSGRLYVVATPIGNLEDLSARAREVLETCSLCLLYTSDAADE